MHDYLLSTEWVRFAFVCGIAVSMLLYERRHLTTGSIVVPGYIAVYLLHPLILIATFLNAFATYAVVNKVLRRYVLLYGRTKFTVLAVVSTVIQTVLLRISPSGPWLWERDIPLFVGVGYIVPALIAHDMARQGIARTSKSVLLAGAIVAVPIALALVTDLPGVNDLSPVDGFGHLAFPVEWLPIAIVVSIVASWALAENYGSRSGGFIGAALAGMFVADIWQVVAAITIATISYLLVAKVLMRHMILFGRRKFSAMLLTSSVTAWPALWIGNQILDDAQLDHVGVGSLALTPLLLPGLLANDVQRTGPHRVAFGLVLAGTCTVTTTWWLGAVVTGQQLGIVWKLIAAGTVIVLLWPQVVRRFISVVERIRRLHSAARAASDVRRPRPAAVWSKLPAVNGPSWALVAIAPPSHMRKIGSEPTVRDHPVNIDWSTSWTEWRRAHPLAAKDAQRWLESTLGLQLSPHASDESESVRTGPDPVPVPADGRSAGGLGELERAAREALTVLLARNPTDTHRTNTPDRSVPLPSPDTALPGIDGTRRTPVFVDADPLDDTTLVRTPRESR